MKNKNMPAMNKSALGRKKLIIANWKMNLSLPKSIDYIKQLKKSNNEVVIAAPYIFLSELVKIANKKKIKLAAQNVSQFPEGAFTGEISALMLKRIGCSYCLVGHSERRIYFQETDSQINEKVKQLLKVKITPIICLGETAEQRKSGQTQNVLKRQLLAALKGIKRSNLVIAYEPVWAISTFQKGKNIKSASLKDIAMAHSLIKKILGSKAKDIRIIYGGTVNQRNCQPILSLKQVDGVLVGGASLNIPSFNAIIQSI